MNWHDWNWTIITVIVCTMAITSSIGSHIGRLTPGLADELDKIKEQLDKLEQSSRDHLRRLESVRSVLDRLAPDPDPLNRLTTAELNQMTPEQFRLFMEKRDQLLRHAAVAATGE
jgi:hypothetical protein